MTERKRKKVRMNEGRVEDGDGGQSAHEGRRWTWRGKAGKEN